MNPESIAFIRGGAELLNEVEPLWRKLNEHHQAKSTHFADRFAGFTFPVRCADLLRKAETGLLLVEMARDREAGIYAGYGISSVDGGGPDGLLLSRYGHGPAGTEELPPCGHARLPPRRLGHRPARP
ncbi:MAG: hypothetical protein ACM3X6_07340 [Patescibacteria group bacterium]